MSSKWPERFARWTRTLAIVAVLIALIGLTLARYDVIPKLAGFSAFLFGALIAALGVLVGVLAFIRHHPGVSVGKGALSIALLVCLGYAGFIASRPLTAGEVPAIHDITTDLANPPAFQTLTLRADNLAGVETVEKWREIHAKAYGRLAPLSVEWPVDQTTLEAEKLARAKGWKIVTVDAAKGHLEATASVSYIRFQDDIIIRVTPAPNGKGSVVNMRSVSRIGVSDFGVNAKRIHEFLSELAAE